MVSPKDPIDALPKMLDKVDHKMLSAYPMSQGGVRRDLPLRSKDFAKTLIEFLNNHHCSVVSWSQLSDIELDQRLVDAKVALED